MSRLDQSRISRQKLVIEPQFAKGFPIHSPALVRDESTLVYMELLGPRQAVKANWAALRQHKKSRCFYGGRLEVTKEDEPITLKTTLPCGWDHWCLIHRQRKRSTENIEYFRPHRRQYHPIWSTNH